MPFNPFSALTSKLFGGLLVLALVFAGVQSWRLSSAQDALEAKRNELATEKARHAVTRQSVDTLQAVITELNNRAMARAEAYAAAKAEAAKRSAELAALSKESDARIAVLRKAAQEQYNGDCPVPPDLAELAKGL